MTAPPIDSDIPGIWIIPGESATYEVGPDGSYHIAEPAAAFSIQHGGQVMTWDGGMFDRVLGEDPVVEGVWRNCSSGEEWYFRSDGSYVLHWPDGEETHGIWSLQHDDRKLWTREHLCQLTTNGAEVAFHLGDGPPARYGYTVDGDRWTLLDPTSWKVLVEYQRA